MFNFLKSPSDQWEIILTKTSHEQFKFIKKVCKVTLDDRLILREAFFDNLSFDLVREIFKLVKKAIHEDIIDYSFQDIILDRLLRISAIEYLYPEDPESEDNIIHGEGYHVYSASYHDLDLLIDFINSKSDINSLCDLGSGPGRAIFYLALEIKKDIQYTGLEIIGERCDFTNEIVSYFDLKNIKFKASDFLETPSDLIGYDAYYLYDPVGTDDVDLLISYFQKMIHDGAKFYLLFISGWDELMLNALDKTEGLEKVKSIKSHKQLERVVNFYKVV